MAIKKANALHPPQSLNPQPPAGPMPVKTHVYRSLTRLNAGFEKVILEFGNLKQINYFRSDPLTAMYNQLLRIRAQANREFIAVLSAREAANAAHFDDASQPSKTEPLAGSTGTDGTFALRFFVLLQRDGRYYVDE